MLHLCNKIFYSECRGCIWLSCLLLGPILPTRLTHPALIEEVPNLTATWYTMADWYPSEVKQWRRKGGQEQVWERNWKEGMKGNFWLGCKSNNQTSKENIKSVLCWLTAQVWKQPLIVLSHLAQWHSIRESLCTLPLLSAGIGACLSLYRSCAGCTVPDSTYVPTCCDWMILCS